MTPYLVGEARCSSKQKNGGMTLVTFRTTSPMFGFTMMLRVSDAEADRYEETKQYEVYIKPKATGDAR